MLKKEIKEIIEKEVLLTKEGNNDFFFTSSNGNWIFDFRIAFLQGKFLQKFSEFFWDKYEEEYPFQIGGLELGAIPLISGIVMEGIKRGKNLNSFFVRKERKSSGLGNKIEGLLTEEKIIIVDDLFNSGDSMRKIYDSLKSEGKDIYKIFVFVNFGSEKGRLFLKENNLSLDYEFSLSDFGLDVFGNSFSYEKEHHKAPIIFPDNQRLFALDNSNKFIEAPKSNPIKKGKNIYFGGEGGKFVSICSDTGKLNWEFSVSIVNGHKNILSSPIIIKNHILFGSYDGNLYCLDINSGKIKRKFIYSEWIGSSPTYSEKYNKVYIGLELGGLKNKGSFVGIDFESGDKTWEVFFDDFVHCSPGYSEKTGLVICGSNDGKIICVRGDNGKIVFERNFKSPIKGGFAFSDNGKTAYFGCFDNNIYAINLLNGKIIWNFDTKNVVYTIPKILGNNLFIGSLDKYFYHLDLNGKLLKKVKTFGKIFSSPIEIGRNIIAFASNDSYIYFYDFINKKVIFVIEHKDRINTKLVYESEYKHLFVYDSLNSLFKYDLNGFID